MSTTRPLYRVLAISCVLGLFVAAPSSPAWAAGYEYGVQGSHAVGRGGAFVVKADDPTAVLWNPGKLALLRGTRIAYSHNIVDLALTYTRCPGVDPTYGGPVTYESVSEQDGFFAMGASAYVTSDFGLENWTFGAGVHGPAALGKSSFSPYAGSSQAARTDPLNVLDGAGRYMFVEKDIMLLYYTLAAAWKYEELFGLGVSLSYVHAPQIKYSVIINGKAEDVAHPAYNALDTRADVDMSDPFAMTAMIGGWVRPLPYLELGFSARVLPFEVKAEGDIEVSGAAGSIIAEGTGFHICSGDTAQGACIDQVETDPSILTPTKRVPATIAMQFPATVQLGARYIHESGGDEVFDIELDYVWENWASMDAYEIEFADRILAVGDIQEVKLQSLRLARNYQDSHSVRLGGQWQAIPGWFVLRAGAMWERAASPEAYSVIDFPSFERIAGALGFSVTWKGLDFSAAYSYIYQVPRCVERGDGDIHQQRLTFGGDIVDGPAANEGKYESHYHVLSFGLGVHFQGF